MADQLRAGGRLALRLLGRRRSPRILQAAPPPVHLHRVRHRSRRPIGCACDIYFSLATQSSDSITQFKNESFTAQILLGEVADQRRFTQPFIMISDPQENVLFALGEGDLLVL